jgi:hypothetical protein
VDDLVRAVPGTLQLSTLRSRLDEWLAREGAPVDDALPWEGEASRTNVDLSSLPPPPAVSFDEAPSVTVEEPDDEDADRPTVPGEALAPLSPRRPRIVPPKLKGRGAAVATPSSAVRGSSQEPRPSDPPAARGVLRGPWVVGAIAALTVGGFFLLREDDADRAPSATTIGVSTSSASPDAPSAASSASAEPSSVAAVAPSSSAPPSASVAPPSASANAQPSSSAAVTASAIANAAGTAEERRDRCVTSALPADTFEGTFVDFAPVCAAGDVLDGAARFRETIVRGGHGRPVTTGMREWSQLGFFELAAFAAIHRKCCEGGALTVPSSPAACPTSVESAIESVVRVDASSKKAVKLSLAELEKAFRCITRSGAEKRFGGHPSLSGGEGTPLTKILLRLSKLER